MRRLVIGWHANMSVAFHENWTKTHKSKMARALAKHEKASILEVEDEDAIDVNNDAISLCPFAMIAKPEGS